MLCVRCEICKAVADDMHVMVVKTGTTQGGLSEEMAAHICDDCWKRQEFGELLHKLRSVGFHSERQQPKAGQDISNIRGPVPVDPNFVRKLQGR